MPIFQYHYLDNRNNWAITENDEVSLHIADGDYAYVFDHKQDEGRWLTWRSLDLDDQGPYKIHAVIEKVSGVSDWGYGIVWQLKDTDNYHTFQIASDGNYMIGKRVKGEWQSLKNWTPCEHIRK
ncbi:MAG: hypothetical protein AAF485_06440, partial [Chloroflexota bacterium]